MPETGVHARVDPVHLRQRLAIEAEGEAPVFGRGRTRFHPENSLSLHQLLRRTLTLTGLYQRGQRNALDIRVHRREVALTALPPALDGFRVLQLSDLHLDSHADFPDTLAERVRALEYDVCVLTGDYRFRTCGSFAPAIEGLARVREALRGSVYAILGNHDSIRMVPEIEAMDIRLLLNEADGIERAGSRLHIAGVDDPHFFRGDNLEKACADLPPDAPSILLSHSPEIFRQAAACGFDLMLCGHTHGGQIRLPGGIPLITNVDCPRRFAAGSWQFGDMCGYTSVGAGSSIVDVRFNCPPEVVIHTLRRAC